jgi:NAD(P)H-dependent FMN reductase
MQEMLEALLQGAHDESIAGVDVIVRPALSAGVADVLESDGVLLMTPANIGYMAGAMKHFFDQIYYPCLDATVGMPYGVCIHGNLDTTGALRAVEMITTGLKWRLAAAPLELTGAIAAAQKQQCWELGATLAASLIT